MPKLVIKQDLPASSPQEKLEGALRVILPVLLFGIAAVAVLSLYLSREPVVPESSVADASLMALPSVYTREDARLSMLVNEFETQDKTALEGYDKHSVLVAQADAILLQLSSMDNMAAELVVTPQNKQTLLTRHQYQKDYWEAKRVFHNLRLSRFQGDKPAIVRVTEPQQQSAVVNVPEKVQAIADNSTAVEPVMGVKSAPKPAPNVELPADFCPLFGPGAAACKPGADAKKP